MHSKYTPFDITVEYHTFEPEDRIFIIWKPARQLHDNPAEQTEMFQTEKDTWKGSLSFPLDAHHTVNFHFEVWRGNRKIDTEPYLCHSLLYSTRAHNLMKCCFIPHTEKNNYRYSSAFRQCIYPFDIPPTNIHNTAFQVIVQDYLCPTGYSLYISGDTVNLGNWDIRKAVPMQHTDNYTYTLTYKNHPRKWPVTYKFLLKSDTGDDVIWESGENRVSNGMDNSSSKALYLELSPLRLPQRDGRLAGIVVPVFSLRSRESWGVGDFHDLDKMVEWASSVNMRALQVLPINDTTRTGHWEDSYPYNAISIFALHPMYANLNALSPLGDKRKQEWYESQREKLNALPQVDYEQVNLLKNSFLKDYYEEHKAEIMGQLRSHPSEGDYHLADMSISTFYYYHSWWLRPYCSFKVLMEQYGTADYRQWPKFSQHNDAELAQYFSDSTQREKMYFHLWVQYILATQLALVHDRAQRRGVILKGDMPIGVSRDSATTWFYPDYFHFNGQAGAPPDFFSALGQNWGFPTYNWNNILKDNGIWWKKRLQYMAHFFDAFRIDHILGFFRIWQIPYGTSDGRLGHFLPDLPLTEAEIQNYGFSTPLDTVCHPQDGEDWNVLFIRDEKNPNLFHPAISGHSTQHYSQLSYQDKQAFDRIHDDFFNRRHNSFWAEEGMKRLPCAVYASPMLVCAEDLGMVPDCVHGIMQYFGILSLEVQSMPKRHGEGPFSWLPNNPINSVDTITTHDMEPLRLWWTTNRTAAQQYFEQRMGGYGPAPETLSPEMAERIVFDHLKSPSLLCIIALQDWLAIDSQLRHPHPEEEVINRPACPRHYWRYRMHIYIEDLMQQDEYNNHIRQLIAHS